MNQALEISNRLIQNVATEFRRSLYDEINWKSRLIEIRGSRGVGKTTLMLQKAHEIWNVNNHAVLYASLDIPYFYKNSLFDFADEFQKHGGEILFLDEVHKYPPKEKNLDWSAEIKGIYDSFPNLKIVYSGSSVLHLYKGSGDLSRRKSGYQLHGFSFREFLKFNRKLNYQIISLDDLIQNHARIAGEILKEIKILSLFKEYLKTGYYPFYKESGDKYYDKIRDVINQIIDNDIPYITHIQIENTEKLKRMLAAISTTVPYTPNLNKLSGELHITDYRTLIKYLNLLEKADLISTLTANATGNKIIQKPDKMYVNNTNLLYALNYATPEEGTIRETFFMNQVSNKHRLNYPQKGDFLVNNEFLFEIGGKNKTAEQISGKKKAYLALDNIETGFGNKIPLWLFGFLY